MNAAEARERVRTLKHNNAIAYWEVKVKPLIEESVALGRMSMEFEMDSEILWTSFINYGASFGFVIQDLRRGDLDDFMVSVSWEDAK